MDKFAKIDDIQDAAICVELPGGGGSCVQSSMGLKLEKYYQLNKTDCTDKRHRVDEYTYFKGKVIFNPKVN